MKKPIKALFAIIAVLLCASFAGCAAPENDTLEIDAAKLERGQYLFDVTYSSNDTVIKRQTTYTVADKELDGVPVISIGSTAESGTEHNYTETLLTATQKDGYTALTPIKYTLDYGDTANLINDTLATAVHNPKAGNFTIEVKKYPQSGGTEMETQNYTVQTSGQYYDTDALQFIIGTLPLEIDYKRNFSVSSVNRDTLTSMYMQCMENVDVTLYKGTSQEVTKKCLCVIVRPNTLFTNYGTYMYYDTDNNNRLVMVKGANYSAELVSFTPAAD